jgi:glycosyltransferase involved in cell wall biosynthesis
VNIVYFIDHLRPDGTQHVLNQLVEGLAARGHRQAVVCLNDSWDAAVVDRLRQAQAEVRIVGKMALATGYGLLSTWRWLRTRQFDVAVTFLFASDVIGRTLARAAGAPRIISSLRARNTNYTRWQRWLVRRTMPWADVVVLNSSYVRNFAIAEEGAPANRILIIPNGVQVENYGELVSRPALCAEFGLPPNQHLVGSVGRLTYQKGFDILLQALALIPRQDVNLLLVGTGEEGNRLRAQAVGLGLARRVHFAGYRHDVPRLLSAFDLYIHPARFEGMPNTLLEAMAAGCPIVASAVDGNRELIDEGINGWLVPADDAAALAEAIQVVLDDPQEAKRRAAVGQARAATQFGLKAVVSAWERVLEDPRYENVEVHATT